MKSLYIAILLLLTYLSNAQLTITIDQLPDNTPVSDEIYIAGNFNQWNPKSLQHKLNKDTDGKYKITFSPFAGKLEFKFTRGSWSTVEGNSSGNYIPNRLYQYNGQVSNLSLQINGWEGLGSNPSTASPQVSILTDSFYMTSLNRYRRIWLYLPKDYSSTTRTYPVLYMHDGQNLFDRNTSFSGEWRIDESLDSLQNIGDDGCIVVGIDNGGSKRLDEYSPWINAQHGGGEGDKYVDFLVDELKPYIDGKFRTKSDPSSTAIIGSSMGGLISLYAGIKYPEVFGKIGPLSSAFWFSQESYNYVNSKNYKDSNQRIFMIAGEQEGGSQVADMNRMKDILINNQFNDGSLNAISHPGQGHNERYWAKEFPKIYKWLFANTVTTSEGSALNYSIMQINDSLCFKGDFERNSLFKILSTNGQLVLEKKIESNEFCTEIPIIAGVYIISIKNSKGQIFSRKFLIE